MDAINLHFTGDFHAITTANNLLASMVDNHMYWGNALGIDQRRVAWRRALDLNDRALRETVVGLGGAGNGFPREEGFDITVASETMAAFCLASDLADLEARLGRMIVGLPARQAAGDRDRPQGGRGDDRAAQGRASAQSRADARRIARARARRPVRQHRPRLQLRRRDPRRAQARRLRRHRSRVRRRPRRGEILRHQVPHGRAEARRRGNRRVGAGAQDAWRGRPATRSARNRFRR